MMVTVRHLRHQHDFQLLASTSVSFALLYKRSCLSRILHLRTHRTQKAGRTYFMLLYKRFKSVDIWRWIIRYFSTFCIFERMENLFFTFFVMKIININCILTSVTSESISFGSAEIYAQMQHEKAGWI